MATQPARPQGKPDPAQKAKAQGDQQMKTYAIIGFGTVIVLVAGYFALNALMTEDRGGRSLVHVEEPASRPAKKLAVDDAPVALLPRPHRLFDEYCKAIMRSDKTSIRRWSELDDAKLDLLMTEERVKIVAEALQTKRMRLTDQVVTGDTARMAAIFQNGKGYDIMELALIMRQKGGPEDWTVTRVEDRWFSSSGKMPEKQTVELGADRTAVAAPIKDPTTFAKMPEAEPTKLDWLPGTGESEKRTIEGHIRDLFDEKNPAKLSRASTALATIGKNAVPPLLNEFIGLNLNKEDDVKRGNSLDRTLAALTDVEMGFDPATFQSAGAIPPAEARMRAIRRWFGWWERNKDQPLPQRNRSEDK